MSQKVNKRKRTWVKIFNFLLVIVFALPVGYYVGGWYANKFFGEPQSMYSEDQLKDNIDSINYKNKKPNQLKASEVFIVGEYILANQKNYIAKSYGEIVASITTQTIEHIIEKNGNTVRQESYSSGLINLASKSEYTGGGIVSVFDGKKNKSNTTVAWNDGSKISNESYKELYGKYPDQPWSYIVSSKTVLSSTECRIENGVYYYTVQLDPVNSVINYRQQIKTLSDLKGYPTFSSVEITFGVDENFRFVSFIAKETYRIPYLGGAQIPVNNSNKPYTTVFSYNS